MTDDPVARLKAGLDADESATNTDRGGNGQNGDGTWPLRTGGAARCAARSTVVATVADARTRGTDTTSTGNGCNL